MQEESAVRQAALDVLKGVEPGGLKGRIHDELGSTSTVPGIFALLCARATTDTPGSSAEVTLPNHVPQRAAGVQLIYDGLRLTRTLAREEAWASGEGPNLDILVADVLVAQGFYLLARTEAAADAVETVRAFGRDQTVRRTADDPALDRNLEADVLELAAVAGSTADSGGTTAQFREYAAELAATVETPTDGFHSPDAFFPTNVRDRLRTLATESPGSEGVTPSVDD